MNFPTIPEHVRIQRLAPPNRKIRMVLDTDTYNEIDDQFALTYSLLSPERLSVEAVYAAPFHNSRSSSPADGMEKSYDEILRLLDKLGHSHDGFAFKGATDYLRDTSTPQDSPAVQDLIARAMASPSDDPLYVVAIGAITNIASAVLLKPTIIDRIVVVWLGGHALHWEHAREFNLIQDVLSARVLLDCGVPFVIVPCFGVTTHLTTTLPELRTYIEGKGAIGDYLVEIFEAYKSNNFARSSVIWDMAPIAYLLNETWTPSQLVHSPIITDQVTWSEDRTRHLIRYVNYVNRDPIWADFFNKIAKQDD